MNKVLIADDVKDMREVLAAIVSRIGLHPILAASGKEVIEKLQTFDKIKLLLLDINMGGTNGIETMKKAKKLLESMNTHVIFVSGDRDKSTILEALDAGGKDYVVKPIDPRLLIQKINSILKVSEESKFHTSTQKLAIELTNIPIKLDLVISAVSQRFRMN